MDEKSVIIVIGVYVLLTPLFWCWINRTGAKSPMEPSVEDLAANDEQHDAPSQRNFSELPHRMN